MYRIRLFAVRHSRAFEWLYARLETTMVALDPLFARVGYGRIERPIAAVERVTKGLLFDCKMCGQCVLSSTGMSCPMNCPKQLRNGPCGGSTTGKCEINPETECAWQLIVDRMKALDKLDQYENLCPIKDWSTDRAGGPRKVVREDVQQ